MSRKKGNGEGHIKQRKNGLWEGQLCYHGTRKSVYGATKAEVRKKLTALQSEFDAGTYIPTCKSTVAQWLQTWQQDYGISLTQSTKRRYDDAIRLHIVPLIGDITLSDLSATAVQRMCNTLIKQGLSPKTVGMIHGTLHTALDKAVKLELIPRNVSDLCELPKVVKKEMNPLKDASLTAFLNAIKGDFYENLFYVDVFTGLRQSEIIGLTWDCIDFNAGTIRIYRQLAKERKAGGTFGFATTKNNRERLIQPATQVMDVLKRVKAKQAEWKLKAGEAWSNPANLVFTNEIGGHLSDVSLRGHFKRIVRSMGLPEVRFHDLRHTFATLSIQNGTDIKTVSQELGHATVAFTMDRYGHVSDAMRQNASDRMTRLINGL